MSPVFLHFSVFFPLLQKQVYSASADFRTTQCWNRLPQKNYAVNPVQGHGIEQSDSERAAICFLVFGEEGLCDQLPNACFMRWQMSIVSQTLTSTSGSASPPDILGLSHVEFWQSHWNSCALLTCSVNFILENQHLPRSLDVYRRYCFISLFLLRSNV